MIAALLEHSTGSGSSWRPRGSTRAILWLVAAVGLLLVGAGAVARGGGRYAVTGPLDVPRSVASGLLTLVTYLLVLFALSRAPLAVVGPPAGVSGAAHVGLRRVRPARGRHAP